MHEPARPAAPISVLGSGSRGVAWRGTEGYGGIICPSTFSDKLTPLLDNTASGRYKVEASGLTSRIDETFEYC
jgi:hypothetical protein